MIMDKFDRLITYFEETKEDTQSDILKEPTIESKWIYAPKLRNRAYDKAEFKREFTINNQIKSAQIQLIADTHAKLYINDKYVGEIYSRRSLSLLTEYDRILFLEAKKYFTKGKNKITIEAESYKGATGAGINFIGQIITNNGSFEVLSDEKWLSRSAESKSNWEKSIIKEYKFKIIAPNFDRKRTSWIER